MTLYLIYEGNPRNNRKAKKKRGTFSNVEAALESVTFLRQQGKDAYIVEIAQ